MLCKPYHHLGYANDSLDRTHDNIAFHWHHKRPQLLLMVLMKDVAADEQGFVPYGGPFFYGNKFPLDVQIKAIRRYGIDARSQLQKPVETGWG